MTIAEKKASSMTGSIDELFTPSAIRRYDDEAPGRQSVLCGKSELARFSERTRHLSKSSDALSRALGRDVLAQLGTTADHPSNSFPDEFYSAITDLVQRETDPAPSLRV
jgi:hypothetical protein